MTDTFGLPGDRVNTVELEPSLTYKLRRATFVRVGDRPVSGVVEIRESIGPKRKTEVARYAVKELSDEEAELANDRHFRLTKEGGGKFYDVLLADPSGPGYDHCDCHGHSRFGRCKHVDALRKLMEAGHLDPD